MIVSWLIKIFLVWLMFHFFLYNFFTFSLWVQLEAIWAWKEIFIVVFALITWFFILKSMYWKQFVESKSILIMEIAFVLMILLWFFVNFIFKWTSIWEFIMVFKYDFMWFMIFFISYHLSYYVKQESLEKLFSFYGKFIKICLVLALVWYAIIAVKPGFFKMFGYDRDIHEWKAGQRPPVVYFTQMNHGFVRNQFVFERPITWWFFLTAFWPLFYILYLRRKSFAKTWPWWWVYGFNILITFSRAAWIGWIAELIILWFLEYRKNIKQFIFKIIAPIVIIIWFISVFLFNDIVMRYFSNSWHIALFKSGVQMFMEEPIWGKGAWSAWPASHQICESWTKEFCAEIAQINKEHQTTDLKWFNTENQFLQILVEFGLVIFWLYFFIFALMSLYWVYIYFKSSKNQIKDPSTWILIAFSVWMIGIGIEWFMLHSFVDRMNVYPMMFLYGIAYSIYVQKRSHSLMK